MSYIDKCFAGNRTEKMRGTEMGSGEWRVL